MLADMDMGFYSGRFNTEHVYMSDSDTIKTIQALKDDYKSFESCQIGSPEYQSIQKKFQEQYGGSIPSLLSLALIKKLEGKGISPHSFCEYATPETSTLSRKEVKLRREQFNNELHDLLNDMSSRGIGISSKMSRVYQSKNKEKKNFRFNIMRLTI